MPLRNCVGHKVIDEGLVLTFPLGKSFTGEESVEFQGHGSQAAICAVLKSLSGQSNTRLAEPGEFTRRALENERMSFEQVEGLLGLIDAETEAQRAQAMRSFEGRLEKKVRLWRKELTEAAALIQVSLDFADEDIPPEVRQRVVGHLSILRDDLEQEGAGVHVAERIRAGFEIALLGPPNSGKSTLLNFIAARDVAIVTDIAGTTRDVLEVPLDIKGFKVVLMDTAGLRNSDDFVEQIGIKRSKERAQRADLRIFLGDPDENLLKADDIVLCPKDDDGIHKDGVSGKTGVGVSELVARLGTIIEGRADGVGSACNMRQKEMLVGAMSHVDRAIQQLNAGIEEEIVAEDIRRASQKLSGLVGSIGVEDVLESVFSNFCLGK